MPVYELSRHFGEIENNPFKNVLKDHRAKYGENLIIQSNRVPLFGYELIDKQWFDKYKIKYNDYHFDRLEYPNTFIPNRGAAWTISFKPEDSEEKTSHRRNINSYNHYLDQLDSIKGFKEFFVEHHCCVSREEITKEWSGTTADYNVKANDLNHAR